jgi:hypothetical protein
MVVEVFFGGGGIVIPLKLEYLEFLQDGGFHRSAPHISFTPIPCSPSLGTVIFELI